MMLKKSALFGMALAIASLPLIAHADLRTTNHTPKDSTVRVKHSGACAGAFGKYTPASVGGVAGESDVRWGEVQALCLGSGSVCSALIYMSKDCSGPVYAEANVNLQTKTVSITSVSPTSPYKFTVGPEASHLNIN